MVFPVIGPVRWRNSYDDNRGSYRHTGVDIAAPKLAPIVAAIAGVLGMKQFSFWIVGQGAWSGWTVLGTHLNDDTPGTNDGCGGRDWMFAPNLRGGDHVAAGQLIGFVGDSGNATGSHLHFELYGPRGVVSPVASLHMAQRLSRPRAVLERPEERPDEGMLRVDGAPRGFDGHSRLLTVAVVARQASDGHAAVPSRPMRFQVRLSESQVAALGGEAGIAALPRDRALRIFIRDAAPSSAVKVAASANTAPVLVAQAR
jgi:murein DD-endopeptidase MepM/ murein hydrolase activator NlpD